MDSGVGDNKAAPASQREQQDAEAVGKTTAPGPQESASQATGDTQTALSAAERCAALTSAWPKLLTALGARLGQKTVDNWLAPVAPQDHVGGTVVLALPNRFMLDWVRANYGPQILEALKALVTDVSDLKWIIARTTIREGAKESIGAKQISPPPRDRLGTPLDERFTFESFVVGRPNQFCYAAARKVGTLHHVEFNPLFIYGGVGLGKTHLMHAIAWEAKKRDPNLRLVYMSAERFMYAFINALRYDNIMQFKAQMRAVDLLLIDDMHFLVGKQSTQEEFFHLFNYLIDNGKQIVISADRAPGDIEGLEERVKSRLAWGLVADVHPTDYELRLSILQTKAQQLGRVEVPEEVLRFLAEHISSNVRELEGALNRIVAHSQLMHKAVTPDMAREVLRDILRTHQRRISIDDIQKAVAEHYNIRLAEMLSERRDRSIVRPRQVAMYLAKKLTTRSLPDIARAFRGRDHTTVLYAVKRVEALRAGDSELDADILLLLRKLEG